MEFHGLEPIPLTRGQEVITIPPEHYTQIVFSNIWYLYLNLQGPWPLLTLIVFRPRIDVTVDIIKFERLHI